MSAPTAISGLPRLLSEFQRCGGVFRADPEDFLVEEIPLYPADGAGTHTYFFIEKRGLSTMNAVHEIATALNVKRRAIGFAGLKDARAVTRQWMSIEHTDPEAVARLELPRVRVLEVTRHGNKLRLGHLRANHFRIRVRDADQTRLSELQDALGRLVAQGVPNYFGPQRFGQRGDTWQIGRALVRRDLDEAVDLILGRPGEHDHGRVRTARQAYEAGDLEAAIHAWPGSFRDERKALKILLRTKGNKRRAFAVIDRGLRKLYVSAYQSYLFNQVVARRLSTGLGKLIEGDLAWLHASGAVFRVEDIAREQARADAFEISPSGPIFGFRMTRPEREAGTIEEQLLAEEGLALEAFKSDALRVKGQRRPLRFRPEETSIRVGADGRGAYLELRFTLARGCYATALLRELFVESVGGAEWAEGEAEEELPD